MVVIVMGVSGAGKTTIGKKLAEKLNCLFLEGDDFHSSGNKAKMESGNSLTDEDRWPWLQSLAEETKRLSGENRDLVLTCSALKKKYRDLLSREVPVRWIYLKGSLDLVRRRLEGRQGHFMGPKLLDSQFADLEEPLEAIVVDITQDSDRLVLEILNQLSGK